MLEITLAKGRGVVQVDDEDFEMLSQYSWRLKKNKHDVTGYAIAWMNGTMAYMHHFVKPGAERLDHIDGNGLNNQKSNLRQCTHQQNMFNQRPRPGKRFKGVYRVKPTGRYRAYIHAEGHRQINLGFYATEEEAAHAYDVAALRMFGEFAWINFPIAPTVEIAA